jgi:hypothetical protein
VASIERPDILAVFLQRLACALERFLLRRGTAGSRHPLKLERHISQGVQQLRALFRDIRCAAYCASPDVVRILAQPSTASRRADELLERGKRARVTRRRSKDQETDYQDENR